MSAGLQDRLRALIAQHCATLSAEARDISIALGTWPDDEGPDRSTLERARGAAHKLKGSSGTIGFTAISERAAELEAMLDRAMEPSAREDRSRIIALTDALTAAVADLKPEQSSLYNRNL